MVHIDDLRQAFTSRLKHALTLNNIPLYGAGKRLSDLINVTAKAASKWLNAESIPRPVNMLALSSGLNVRIEWLEYGRGAVSEELPIAEVRGDYAGERASSQLQYLQVGFHSTQRSVDSPPPLAFGESLLALLAEHPNRLRLIRTAGHDMAPTIADDDLLLIDEAQVTPVDGQIFALHSDNKGTIIRRLVLSDLQGWIIRCDNPDKVRHGDQFIALDALRQHRLLGRVIWRGGLL